MDVASYISECRCGAQLRHTAPGSPQLSWYRSSIKKKKKVHVVDLHPDTGSTEGPFMSNELIMLQDHDRPRQTAPSV